MCSVHISLLCFIAHCVSRFCPVLLFRFCGYYLKVCPHTRLCIRKQATLLPFSATKSPVSGYKVACFGNKWGQALRWQQRYRSDCKAKMHQIRFLLGSIPDTAEGSLYMYMYSVPLPRVQIDPLTVFKGPTTKGRKGKRTGGHGETRQGRVTTTTSVSNSWLLH